MIYVDAARACGAPWRGGVACHLISDESVDELKSFAALLGLLQGWFQAGSYPHFDISPAVRARAVRLGALEADRRAYVAAVRRGRSRGVGLVERQAYLATLRARLGAQGGARPTAGQTAPKGG